jgi:uncharacterized phosphosugar-binding protein
MNRRDTLRMLPLTIAGTAGLTGKADAQQPSRPGEGLNLYEQYSGVVRKRLNWIRNNQSENLLEASYAIARTVLKGNKCWSMWDTGHSTQNDQFPDRNGEPVIIDSGWNANAAQKGDLLLANRWRGPYDVVKEKDIFVIGGPAPVGGDALGQEKLEPVTQRAKIRPHSRIWIETNITTMGPEVYLPGEPAPFGAVSGILGMVQYWMMLADACRILSREGYKGQVEGDEPKLTEKAPWMNSGQPLMGQYFDTVMDQIEMVKGEMGEIRKAAKAIVDVVLSGGSVYYYSRYYAGLATEALGRRGGLALNKSDWEGNKNFKGARRDIMIMGLCKPDDEVDLKHLDAYRKLGMKVFSLGPETRNGRIPQGRTVPKETDMHLGRIADTYGLYAVPGFDQKVCPSSGPVMNQVYWALQMEVAEEIIRRTGNIPGIFMSYVIKGGNEHNEIVRRRVDARGY